MVKCFGVVPCVLGFLTLIGVNCLVIDWWFIQWILCSSPPFKQPSAEPLFWVMMSSLFLSWLVASKFALGWWWTLASTVREIKHNFAAGYSLSSFLRLTLVSNKPSQTLVGFFSDILCGRANFSPPHKLAWEQVLNDTIFKGQRYLALLC